MRLLALSGIGTVGILLGLLGYGGCAPTPTAPIVRVTNWTPKVLPDVKGPLYKWHLAKYLRDIPRAAPFLDPKTHPHGYGKAECASCHELAPSANTKDCAGCHGSNGSTFEPDDCQSCHRSHNVDGRPTDRLHLTHLTTQTKRIECASCHPTPDAGSDFHANGTVNVTLVQGDFFARVRQSETPSCANSDCHEARKWSVDSCAECHGYPPNTGSHLTHLIKVGELRPDMACESCHRGFQHESGKVDVSPGAPGFEAYDASAGTCVASCHEDMALVAEATPKPKRESKWGCADCHATPPDSGNHQGAAHRVVPCGSCHTGHAHSDAAVKSPKVFHSPDVQVEFAGGGTYRNGLCTTSCHEQMTWGDSCGACHGYPPETGDHVVHVRQEGMRCRDCHANNDHDLVRETGYIDVKGDFVYEPTTGSCQTKCHEKVERWDCTSCHAFPPSDGIHPAHTQPKERFWDIKAMSARMNVPDLATNGVACAFCHADHQHTANAAVDHRNFAKARARLVVGAFYRETERCQNACHEPFSWQERCANCHPTPPPTGDHPAHIGQKGVVCESCHGTIEHTRPANAAPGYYDPNGVVEVKFIDLMTGDCETMCHLGANGKPAVLKWNCASCHGTPPNSGAHADHDAFAMGCRTCHANHVHNGSAVIEPVQFNRAVVQFSVTGSFDRVTRTCTDIGCHRKDLWQSGTERTFRRARGTGNR
jgi:hypothetical protein